MNTSRGTRRNASRSRSSRIPILRNDEMRSSGPGVAPRAESLADEAKPKPLLVAASRRQREHHFPRLPPLTLDLLEQVLASAVPSSGDFLCRVHPGPTLDLKRSMLLAQARLQ